MERESYRARAREIPPSEERRRRREMQRRRARKRRMQIIVIVLLFFAALLLLLHFHPWAKTTAPSPDPSPALSEAAPPEDAVDVSGDDPSAPEEAELEPAPEKEEDTRFRPKMNAAAAAFPPEMTSEFALLVDASDGAVLAQKGALLRMYPASMTKVMTLLVAAEHLSEADLQKTFTYTLELSDYCYVNDCSIMGLKPDDTVTVKDLLYGLILPSGADAALGLAITIAGSQEDFVPLMNEKLEELGIAGTSHFTNCIGLFDENHYVTPCDMAVIMRAAMADPLCREILGTRIYKTGPVASNPDGLEFSNWFIRRIEDKDSGRATVIGAKTGYTSESGSCAVSYAALPDGKEYICVTGNAHSAWRAIYDHVEIYHGFFG